MNKAQVQTQNLKGGFLTMKVAIITGGGAGIGKACALRCVPGMSCI
jgi:NADP-dependent 3-hydroxy acid dehydrogenase YdfG